MIAINVRQIKISFICLFFLIVTHSFSQTGREILNRYLDTVSMGNVNNWSKIKTIYATSIFYYSSEDFGHKIQLSLYNNLGYKKILKIWPEQQKEEIYKDSLYKGTPNKFYFLKKKHVIIMGMMTPIETPAIKSVQFDFFPVKIKNYINKSKSIRFIGLKELPGHSPCYEIDIDAKEGKHQLFFNTKTFLLEGIYFPATKDYMIISDYKNVDGYLIPTSTTTFKNGVKYAWETITAIVLNGPIDPLKFIPPN